MKNTLARANAVAVANNLAHLVLHPDDRDHAEIAIVERDEHQRRAWTVAEILSAMAAVQEQLEALEAPSRARVLLHAKGDVTYAVAHLAAIASGFISVPTSPLLTQPELAWIAVDCEPSITIGRGSSPAGLPTAAHIDLDALCPVSDRVPLFVPVDSNDPAYLVYTSGTSGSPRGVLHAHRSVAAREPMRGSWSGIESSDRLLHAGTLNWTYTMGLAIYDAFRWGARSIVYTGARTPHIWPQLVQEERATIFAAVPTVYRQILKHCSKSIPQAFQSLRHGLCAGEALPEQVYRDWKTRVGTELYEALGMSEVSTFISTPPGVEVLPGSPGLVQPGRRVAVLDAEEEHAAFVEPGTPGVLAVHKDEPGLMLGYWGDSVQAPFRGDWFVTGDIVRIDENERVHFIGRSNDMMNAFGYRVSPIEVEEILRQAPGVADVGVAETQVREDVAVIGAFIVPEELFPATEDSILEWANERLAAYKVPREIRFVRSLPRNRSGKLMRAKLAEHAVDHPLRSPDT